MHDLCFAEDIAALGGLPLFEGSKTKKISMFRATIQGAKLKKWAPYVGIIAYLD